VILPPGDGGKGINVVGGEVAMRLTIEIPDDQILRLLEPIVKVVPSQRPAQLQADVRVLPVREGADDLARKSPVFQRTGADMWTTATD